MARVCQLTDDLKYYLCIEPVDMRKQFKHIKYFIHRIALSMGYADEFASQSRFYTSYGLSRKVMSAC